MDLIITELAVFEVNKQEGLTLIEKAEGVSVEDILAKTEAPFKVFESRLFLFYFSRYCYIINIVL